MQTEEYLKKVTFMLDDLSMRDEIRGELSDHIEDLACAYMEQGMSLEEAERKAVQQMGNPKETGDLFNKVYHPKLEWKAALYILVWTVGMGIVNLTGVLEGISDGDVIPWIGRAIGIFFIVLGFLWSAVEKYNDYELFYAVAENWGRGTYVWNACAFLGFGIGMAADSIPQMIYVYLIMTSLTLIQRAVISEKHTKKEKEYLWKSCRALEDFDYLGKVQMEDKTVKVQIKKGEKVKKDDALMVSGLDGFRLVVEKV